MDAFVEFCLLHVTEKNIGRLMLDSVFKSSNLLLVPDRENSSVYYIPKFKQKTLLSFFFLVQQENIRDVKSWHSPQGYALKNQPL